MQSIALLGLGVMGTGMAHRLLNAGFPLTVYNRTRATAGPLAEAGATIADTPAAAVEHADVILSMLADDNACRAVWLGENGAAAAAKPGAIFIESSTITPNWVHELAAAAKAKGCDLLDAPVSGSKVPAATGQLVFFVGGDANVLDRVRNVLAPLSRDVIYLGPTGSGATLKLINNFMSGVQVASLAEAVAWAERSGLDSSKVLDILANGAPGSPMIKTIAARIERADYTPNFFLKLVNKDLLYSIQVSGGLRTAEAAQSLFADAIGAGLGNLDMSAVVQYTRDAHTRKSAKRED